MDSTVEGISFRSPTAAISAAALGKVELALPQPESLESRVGSLKRFVAADNCRVRSPEDKSAGARRIMTLRYVLAGNFTGQFKYSSFQYLTPFADSTAYDDSLNSDAAGHGPVEQG